MKVPWVGAAAFAVVCGCAGTNEPVVDGAGLPVRQFALLGDLCPTRVELVDSTATVRRAARVRQQRARRQRDN